MSINQKKTNMKSLDFKDWGLIVLGIALIVSVIIGQRKTTIDTHQDDINALTKENNILIHRDDSIKAINLKLDAQLKTINQKLDSNDKALTATKLQLIDLKNRKNEIHTYVEHLSGNDVSSSFSNYLQNRTKSNHSN